MTVKKAEAREARRLQVLLALRDLAGKDREAFLDLAARHTPDDWAVEFESDEGMTETLCSLLADVLGPEDLGVGKPRKARDRRRELVAPEPEPSPKAESVLGARVREDQARQAEINLKFKESHPPASPTPSPEEVRPVKVKLSVAGKPRDWGSRFRLPAVGTAVVEVEGLPLKEPSFAVNLWRKPPMRDGEKVYWDNPCLWSDAGLVLFGRDGGVERNWFGYRPLVPFEGLQVRVVAAREFKKRDAEGKKVHTHPLVLNAAAVAAREQHFRGMAASDRVVAGYADSGKMVLWVAPGKDEYLGWLTRKGWSFDWSAPKLPKRMKALLSPYLLAATAEGEVAVRYLEDGEKELDGWVVVRESLFARLLEFNAPARQDHFERVRDAKVYSFRMFGPDGLVKGHATVRPDAQMPEGVDVLTHRCNLKAEVRTGGEYVFGFNPQGDKGEANLNVQFLLNFKFLQREAGEIADNYFESIKYRLANDLPLETHAKVLESLAEHERDQLESVYLGYRQKALVFARAGLSLRHSKTLLEQCYKAATLGILPRADAARGLDKVSLPVPCSRTAQVISVSAARLSGFPVEVPEGTILWLKGLGVAVVSDADWVKNQEYNHGGCDLDDAFALICRTGMDGREKVLVARVPNYVGEYAAYDPLNPGDWPSSWSYLSEAERSRVTFPLADLSDLGPTVKELVDSGKLQVGTLDKPAKQESHPEGRGWLATKVSGLFAGGGAGLGVNAVMLSTHVLGKAGKKLPCRMEEMIDAPVQLGQSGNPQIDEYAELVCRTVKEMGLPVDRLFAERFPEWKSDFRLVDGQFARLHRRVERLTRETWAWVQSNLPLQAPHQLGEGDVGADVVKAFHGYKVLVAKKLSGEVALEFPELYDLVFDALGYSDEKVRQFARLIHAGETRGKGKLSDGVLLNEGGEHGLWQSYRRVLLGL